MSTTQNERQSIGDTIGALGQDLPRLLRVEGKLLKAELAAKEREAAQLAQALAQLERRSRRRQIALLAELLDATLPDLLFNNYRGDLCRGTWFRGGAGPSGAGAFVLSGVAGRMVYASCTPGARLEPPRPTVRDHGHERMSRMRCGGHAGRRLLPLLRAPAHPRRV